MVGLCRRSRGQPVAAAPDGPCLVALFAMHVLAAAGTLDTAGQTTDYDEVEGDGNAAHYATKKPCSIRW